jgi:O-antigen ligase
VATSLTRSDGPWIFGLGFLAALIGVLAGIDPKLAIGASFGLGFLLLAVADLTAGLIAFVLISFLEFVLPGGSVLSLTKLAGLTLTLSWVAAVVSNPRERLFFSDHPGATMVLGALLGFGAISALWSESTSGTWLDLSRYLQVAALLVITYSAIRTREDVRRLVGALLIGITITAAYGLVNRPDVDPAAARLASTVGDANAVAAFLVVGLVLAGAVALGGRAGPLKRAALVCAVPLFLAAFIFTGSRSGVLSLTFALVAMVAFAGKRRPQALMAALVAAVVAFGVFVAFAPDSIKTRISQTTPGQVSPEEGRRTLWAVGWRMFEDEPVRGVGLGSFRASSVHYILEPGALTRTDTVIDIHEPAHNVYLQVLAEEGLIGEILFLAVLVFPIACALRAAGRFASSGDQEMEIYSRALAVAIVAFCVSNFFVPFAFNKVFWILLGAGPVLLAISRAGLANGAHRSADAA